MNNEENKAFQIAVLTISDKGAAGERQDLSGPVLANKLQAIGQVFSQTIVPDDRQLISDTLVDLSDSKGAHLIITTGGTGLSSRDVTPEATLDIAEKLVPGIAEAMRAESMKITNRAMLSRGVAAVRGPCLIINMPGSPRAADECLDIVFPVLLHALEILTGRTGECARR